VLAVSGARGVGFGVSSARVSRFLSLFAGGALAQLLAVHFENPTPGRAPAYAQFVGDVADASAVLSRTVERV